MVIKENSSTANCEACPLLKKAPCVCNACPKREATADTRNSSTTQKELSLIMKLSSESRTGVALNKEEFYRMDVIVSAAIQKGQHLNHIIASNELSVSRASIYRYLEKAICPQSPLISHVL